MDGGLLLIVSNRLSTCGPGPPPGQSKTYRVLEHRPASDQSGYNISSACRARLEWHYDREHIFDL